MAWIAQKLDKNALIDWIYENMERFENRVEAETLHQFPHPVESEDWLRGYYAGWYQSYRSVLSYIETVLEW